jgi:hypothetical protein
MLASLNEDWQDDFVPRRDEEKGYLGDSLIRLRDYLDNSADCLLDEREAIMVNVDSDLLGAADAAAEAERREVGWRQARLEEERRLLKARKEREQASRNMLTDGRS